MTMFYTSFVIVVASSVLYHISQRTITPAPTQ